MSYGIAGSFPFQIANAVTKTFPVGLWSFDVVSVDLSGTVSTVMSSAQGGGFLVLPASSFLVH
jgi:hypothetical protein